VARELKGLPANSVVVKDVEAMSDIDESEQFAI
jgi:hypothetical protein